MCEFFTSRDAFMLAIGRTDMLAATFATSRANMHAATGSEPTSLAQRWHANTTVLSFALSFSHLTSGLPFDFSLQPGLIREVAGRRLQQERRQRVRPRLSRPGRWHDRVFPSSWRSMFSYPQPQQAVAAGARAHRRRGGRRRRDGGSPDGMGTAEPRGSVSDSYHSLRSARSSRVSQIRFDQHESAASISEREAAGALRGNGGDDFTFSFPRDEWGLYDVHAFGLEILDDTVLENETFTVYDHGLHRLGMLRLHTAQGTVVTAAASAAATALHGAAPPAVHEAVAVAGGESAFIGFSCAVPVGFASFDESDDVSGDQVGVASFVFGYRERDAASYPPHMWAGLACGLLLALLLEGAWLRGVGPRVGLRAATGWAIACAAGALLGALALWQLRGWRQAVLFCVCFSMNGMLSFDNLFVLIMLLQQARLPPQHHLRAVCHGVIAALCLRLPLVLCGAALLRRFGWILLAFAALLLLTGVRMLVWPEPPPQPPAPSSPPRARLASEADRQRAASERSCLVRTDADAEGDADTDADAAPPADLCAVRCLSACGVPLVWNDETDGAYLARDARGVLCVTRLAVVVAAIATSDCLFAMDSVPAVLSLSGSPFVLLSSQCASLLGLRPLYFMLAAVATLLDSMQQALAVVLILIALKIFLETAGYEVPLLGFAAALIAWRVVTVCVVLRRRHDGGSGPGDAEQQDSAAPATQLTQLLADDSRRCEGVDR